ncbi:MAG: alkaline phosphatase family protein, partial [Akkermansiaceae bacterium]|nr:alkaline phosphatase family protein [Verrucomicrobiales bacterium]
MKILRETKSTLHNIQKHLAVMGLAGLALAGINPLHAAPKNVLISLDGATPRFLEKYLTNGVLNPNQGLGLLKQKGLYAKQNLTVSPSLTAAGHIAIATGSSAAKNDVVANSFQLLASPFGTTISGFGAPIGGYDIHGPAESHAPTAEPLWLALRAAGKKVVAATFPGADGVNVTIPGLANSPIVQPASERTVDYTIPFGAFADLGAQGFSLTAANFVNAPDSVGLQLTNAGKVSFSEIKIKSTALETLVAGGITLVLPPAPQVSRAGDLILISRYETFPAFVSCRPT